MNLTQGEVGHTVNELAERDLVRVEYGERAHRVSHRMRSAFRLDRRQQAVMAVLMLRKPQTLNDIRVRTERMVDIDGAEEILLMLDDLMQREPALAVCIPKGAGRREDRYFHLLCGEVVPEEAEHPVPALPDVVGRLEARVDELEKQLMRLLKVTGMEP